MQPEEHGGTIFRAARELGRPITELIDFSASINPLGMPPAVLEAARAALADAIHYPEAEAGTLAEALADHHRLPEGHLLPGNGSTDLLYQLPRQLSFRRALLVTPAFGEYGRSLRQAGTAIDIHPLAPESAFHLEPKRLLQALAPDTDLLLLANPGNPTGSVVPPQTVLELAERLAGRAMLAVDEAFIDFCPENSVLERVPQLKNLLVLRSLTKFYAIPGLRAGYLAGPRQAIARLAAAMPPWSLSVPATAAALACLQADDYRRSTLELIPVWRSRLAEGLRHLGLTVFPSAANYLLARLPVAGSAARIVAALRHEGILVRNCVNFPPLDGSFLRMAVRTEGENNRLLAALAPLLSSGVADGQNR